eukprot:Seg84.1 transcript_id=Seg84.1/GoldUCD/mRNA.D3Y31 product="DnaJ protein" protein_id=Seg84.1/GoldUCD/D3Y31
MASAMEDLPWMDTIREKLIQTFDGREEDLCRILFFLDEENSAYMENQERPYAPQWRSLKATINNEKAFKMLAEKLSEDTKRANKDQAFRYRMNMVYEQMLDYSEDSLPADHCQGFDLVRFKDSELNSTSVSAGFARAWSMIPAAAKDNIREILPRLISDRRVVSSIDEFVGMVDKTGGTVVMVGLAAVHLFYKAYQHIKRWWAGEISGKRCAKSLIDDTAAIIGGMTGGVGGAALGSLLGPCGTVLGGIVGGWVAAATTNVIFDRLTQTIFGIPQSEALEKAYIYLGVEMSSSNGEVNKAFRQLCLKHHPDKGGDTDEFVVLQCHMAVIRQARGEY